MQTIKGRLQGTNLGVEGSLKRLRASLDQVLEIRSLSPALQSNGGEGGKRGHDLDVRSARQRRIARQQEDAKEGPLQREGKN
jgi:hypothetical protein